MQLDLWQTELDAQPWGGRSPRALTSVAKSFIFQARAPKDERFFVDPEQLVLIDEPQPMASPIWGGSPSLLPLPVLTQQEEI